jgi:proteasome lid subunit RPN8/RPN11
MVEMYELELGKAGQIVASEMCKVRKSETVLLTVDSIMDTKPVVEVAKACKAAGGKVMLSYHSTPKG